MEKLKAILETFGITEGGVALQAIGHGLINDTYSVSYEGQARYILQRINQQVFLRTEALTNNIELLLPLLQDPEYGSFRLYPDREGNRFPRINGEIWRLMEYLPDSTVHQTTSDPRIAFEAGKVLRIFHRLLAGFDTGLLQLTLSRFHDVHFRMEQFRTAREGARASRLVVAEEQIRFVDQFSEEFTGVDLSQLPVRACHNDTKLNNFLFTSEGKGLCLIDLDTLMPGSILFDLGDAIRTVANPAKEDEANLERIGLDLNMFASFIRGFGAEPGLLTAKEKELVPWSAAYMPFLHGLRALTDYLENDRYYKVSYPEQNLDRCKSLLKFAGLALENRSQMRAVINAEIPG